MANNEIITCSAKIAQAVGSHIEILVKPIVYGGVTTIISEFLHAILDAYELGNIDANGPEAAFNIWIAAVRDYAFSGCIVVAAARWKSILAMALTGIYRA